MHITYSPKDRRLVSSTLVRTVPVVFLSRNSGRLLRLFVNVYRYPCGRLWFHIPCSSFCFAPRINGFGDVSFQSVSEMLPYTYLPTELLYSRLGVRPYRCK